MKDCPPLKSRPPHSSTMVGTPCTDCIERTLPASTSTRIPSSTPPPSIPLRDRSPASACGNPSSSGRSASASSWSPAKAKIELLKRRAELCAALAEHAIDYGMETGTLREWLRGNRACHRHAPLRRVSGIVSLGIRTSGSRHRFPQRTPPATRSVRPALSTPLDTFCGLQ